jgi:hypothetical protein
VPNPPSNCHMLTVSRLFVTCDFPHGHISIAPPVYSGCLTRSKYCGLTSLPLDLDWRHVVTVAAVLRMAILTLLPQIRKSLP